jgi:hypothetical protein|nr:MAG TPA: hypothetical protein [Caudoviricetes sp.]
MIIVSQDKVANINYNNIEAIYMLKKDDKIEINVRGNYDYTIGKYKTEERAKEVLQEIVKTYVLTEQYKVEDERTRIKLMMEGVLLYEMPKE